VEGGFRDDLNQWKAESIKSTSVLTRLESRRTRCDLIETYILHGVFAIPREILFNLNLEDVQGMTRNCLKEGSDWIAEIYFLVVEYLAN